MAFTIEQPRTLPEALAALAQGDETVRAVGGGTGLALLMRYGFFEPTTLVSLQHLREEFGKVEAPPEGGVRMGAMATLRDLQDAPEVGKNAPLLRQALEVLATVRLRNVAQLGGAIAHGHPQMDLPPVLLALDAEVHAANTGGRRVIPASELFLGYYETAIDDDELITEIVIPPLPEHQATYRKVTAHAVDDWPVLGIAALAVAGRDGVRDLRVAVGALTERPQRLSVLEDALVGAAATPRSIAEAAAAASEQVEVHDTPSASEAYQRQIVRVHLRRVLTGLLTGDETSSPGER